MRLALAIASLTLLAGCSTPTAAVLPPLPSTPPHPNSIVGQLSRPWHHVGTPVSAQRQAEDEAKCKVIAGLAPSGDEIKFLVQYINCLKAFGYQPDPPK